MRSAEKQSQFGNWNLWIANSHSEYIYHPSFLHYTRINPIQDGRGWQKAPPLLPVFPLQFLQTYELAPKTF